jgi:hypothetical protein
MKRSAPYCLSCVSLAMVFLAASVAMAGGYHKEIRKTNEHEVRIKLESAFGTVIIGKGESEKILVFDLKTHGDEKTNVDVEYHLKNNVGYLNVDRSNDGNHSFSVHSDDDRGGNSFSDFESGSWYLRFTDAVPLSMDLELGVGKGDFDLSGLNVKDFKLSTGASSTTLTFGEPNESVIDNFQVESGVSKFVGNNLCNANFRRFTFEGGVGTYYLNFAGELTREVDAHIKIGLGAVTLDIPKNIGAKVMYNDTWLSSFSIDREFTEENKGTYVTPNYDSAKGKMDVYVESGLGSVKIRRSEQ